MGRSLFLWLKQVQSLRNKSNNVFFPLYLVHPVCLNYIFSVTMLNHMLCVKVTYKLGVLGPHPHPWDIFGLRSISTFWAQKKRQKKLSIFKKVLNRNKTSCIISCVKMSGYSQYVYYSQKELKYCGLEIWVVYKVLGHFNYIKSLCAKLFYIFSKKYFETKCCKK